MTVRKRSKAPWVILAVTVVLAVCAMLTILMGDVGTEYKTVPRIPAIPTEAQTQVLNPLPVPRDFVAQAMPEKLSFGRVGEAPLIDRVSVDQSPALLQTSGPDKGSVMPNSTDKPAVQDDPNLPWAVLPGTGVGTTVIVGHSKADSKPPMVFNPLTQVPPSSDKSSGYQAVLELPGGTLTAELTKVYLIPKSNRDWGFISDQVPDRWFFISCDLEPAQITGQLTDTEYTRVLEFHLISSKAV